MATFYPPEIESLLTSALDALGHPLAGWRWQLLQGDGSDRRFYRLNQGRFRFIVLYSPRRNHDEVDENDSFYWINQVLAADKLPVARMYYGDPRAGFFLLEDLGDLHLQDMVISPRGRRCLEGIYRKVLRLLIQLHRRVPKRFRDQFCYDGAVYDPPFVYERELEYFRRAFLRDYVGLVVESADLKEDFEKLACQAGSNSRHQIMHRDFQSRNLMVHQHQLRLIDYQGMRFGPSCYDLAALLLDPYTNLPEASQNRLLRFYWTGAQDVYRCSYRSFLRRYEAVRLCRHLQVLAAFAFLSENKGKRFFAAYIPPAWRGLCRFLRRLQGVPYPRLFQCVDQINHDTIFLDRIEQKKCF